MARVKLKIVGSIRAEDISGDATINAADISKVIQQIESRYPQDYYFNLDIFVNGHIVSDRKKGLHDGDEVTIIPIMIGG